VASGDRWAARDRAAWVAWVVANTSSTNPTLPLHQCGPSPVGGARLYRERTVSNFPRRRRAPRRRTLRSMAFQAGFIPPVRGHRSLTPFVRLPVRARRSDVYIALDGGSMTIYEADDPRALQLRDDAVRAMLSRDLPTPLPGPLLNAIPAGMESDSGDSDLSWPW
jgi:hypothetical protein